MSLLKNINGYTLPIKIPLSHLTAKVLHNLLPIYFSLSLLLSFKCLIPCPQCSLFHAYLTLFSLYLRHTLFSENTFLSHYISKFLLLHPNSISWMTLLINTFFHLWTHKNLCFSLQLHYVPDICSFTNMYPLALFLAKKLEFSSIKSVFPFSSHLLSWFWFYS